GKALRAGAEAREVLGPGRDHAPVDGALRNRRRCKADGGGSATNGGRLEEFTSFQSGVLPRCYVGQRLDAFITDAGPRLAKTPACCLLIYVTVQSLTHMSRSTTSSSASRAR